MPDKTDLAALVGSRICHDLISPIGAIGNGVELMMMDRASASPELALIAESVASANARIRYFRVAFGTAGADQRIARSEVTGILSAISLGGRLKLEWNSASDIDRRDVKLAFLLLQCLESALPYGGRVRISQTDAGEAGGGWRIDTDAARMRVEPRYWEMFTEGNSAASTLDRDGQAVPASHVQFALVLDVLRARALALQAQFTAETISVIW